MRATHFEKVEAEWKSALKDLETLVLARGALGRALEIQENKVNHLARRLDALRRGPAGLKEFYAP